jgi:hypothetical protein
MKYLTNIFGMFGFVKAHWAQVAPIFFYLLGSCDNMLGFFD